MPKFKITLLFAFLLIFMIGCLNNKNKLSPSKNNEIKNLFSSVDSVIAIKSTPNNYTDKIHNILLDSENDSLTRHYYLELASIYYDTEDYEKYLKICKEVSWKFRAINDSSGISKSYFCIGAYHYTQSNYDSAFYYYSKAEKFISNIDSQNNLGDIISSKANILSYRYDFAGAEVKAVKALKIGLKFKNNRLIYDCYLTIGNAESGMNNNVKAIEYYKKAFQYTDFLKKDIQYKILKAQPYNFIAKVYQKEGNYTKSIKYAQDALHFCDFKKIDAQTYCYLINTLGYSQLKMNNNSCHRLFKEALIIADSLKIIPVQITSRLNLSEYYLSKKDTSNSIHNVKEARFRAHNNALFEDELQALKLLEKADPRNAYSYKECYIKLSDSLQNIERATKEKYARIEYETDEIVKEKEIVTAEKEKVYLQLLFVIVTSVLILSLSILLYFNTKQKSKSKQLQLIHEQQIANEKIYHLMLDQQKNVEKGKNAEKKRISQELHDGVIGKLMGIRMNLYILKRKTDSQTILECLEQIKGLQEIEKEIRNISHDLSNSILTSHEGFSSVIKKFFSELESHSNLNFHIDIHEDINWELFSNIVKMHIYRIIQESLHNTVKYADAKNSYLKISKHDECILIEISDDGKGFRSQKIKKGMGLISMLDRAREINGELEILSEKGTKINLKIPI